MSPEIVLFVGGTVTIALAAYAIGHARAIRRTQREAARERKRQAAREADSRLRALESRMDIFTREIRHRLANHGVAQ